MAIVLSSLETQDINLKTEPGLALSVEMELLRPMTWVNLGNMSDVLFKK